MLWMSCVRFIKVHQTKQEPSSDSHQFQGYHNTEGNASPVANNLRIIKDSHMFTQFSPPQKHFMKRSIEQVIARKRFGRVLFQNWIWWCIKQGYHHVSCTN